RLVKIEFAGFDAGNLGESLAGGVEAEHMRLDLGMLAGQCRRIAFGLGAGGGKGLALLSDLLGPGADQTRRQDRRSTANPVADGEAQREQQRRGACNRQPAANMADIQAKTPGPATLMADYNDVHRPAPNIR